MKLSSYNSTSTFIFKNSFSSTDEVSLSETCDDLPDDLQTSLIHSPSMTSEISTHHSDSTAHTVAAILKSFAGSAVLFQPRAVYNGGLLAYIFTMFCVFVCAMFCTHLLVQTAEFSNLHSFSDIAKRSHGKLGQALVDISIVMTQLGFCAVYCVFICTNVRDLILYLTNCDGLYSNILTISLIIQCIIFIPLVWVRRLKYYGPFVLAADAFIMLGLFGMLFFIIKDATLTGFSEIKLINFEQWPVMLGTTIYSWEGISMILPIRSSITRNKQKNFEKVLFTTLTFYLISLVSFCTISYLTYGENTHPIILLNLPANRIILFIQFLYILAVIITYPFMMFPAAHAIESRLFKYATGYSLTRKWRKNTLRGFLVLISVALALIGMQELDNFVALIGSFCCVPLMFIYPTLFHIKLIPTSNITIRILRLLMLIFGVSCLTFTTFQAINLWHELKLASRCGF